MIDKQLVAGHFGRAAETYEEYALVQQQMAQHLLSLLVPHGPFTRILEIGCGPGTLTKHLVTAWPAATLWATDISPAMLHQAQHALGTHPRLRFACQDGEDLTITGPFDLIIANAAFQWFTRPALSFRHFSSLLKPGGILAYGTFGTTTFHELRTAFAQAYCRTGLTGSYVHGPGFRSAEDYRVFSADAGLSILRLEEHSAQQSFPTVRAFLQAVKRIGAGNAAPAAHISSSRRLLSAMQECYTDLFRQPDGSIPATYHLLYGLHQKPDST